MENNDFIRRHIGPSEDDTLEMLKLIGVNSLSELVDQALPHQLRITKSLVLPEPLSEQHLIESLRNLAKKNVLKKSFLGQGYYNTCLPAVIQRNILENPGWYTAYTPYQAEISQGRLEALLNFQTMISDLTGLPVANASLLDEGTAAAEAMTMAYSVVKATSRSERKKIFVSSLCFRQTIDVLLSRATPLEIDLVVGNPEHTTIDNSYFSILLQYPNDNGSIVNYQKIIEQAHSAGALVIVATDLLALTLLKPPGEFGADIIVGSAQRFGLPLGYGGPHAAFLATKKEYIRFMPGRIIGISIDADGQKAYRMTLQTREQHIRREKATSNICTAQALLAIIAGMYAVYHGPQGLKTIAERVHKLTKLFATTISSFGYKQLISLFFDTIRIEADSHRQAENLITLASDEGYNLRFIEDKYIGVSFDETTTLDDVNALLKVFAAVKGIQFNIPALAELFDTCKVEFPEHLTRSTAYLTHPVFNIYHSETAFMRYCKYLENKDLSLTSTMIPLGSCTMKLNPAVTLLPITWQEFSSIHPFVSPEQAQGYRELITELGSMLCTITGFDGITFQPNSGAQGEFTGLSIIRAYHQDQNQSQRTIALIPSSAHGTNPASAVMAGFTVVVVQCDSQGNIDVDDLKKKLEQYKNSVGVLMVTYPSTHGVFEERIKEICSLFHQYGGQVYMDGANLNAQVGFLNPAELGADVCHINLHKTFAIPHGGGGPGMGPVCVAKHLVPYLPRHIVTGSGSDKSIPAVASAPFGSANILIISYSYLRLLGSAGLKKATAYALLNANYLKSCLEPYYPVLYQGKNKRVAHEFIINLKQFKENAGIEAEDVAKRLMDYGFHAPTVSFPVPGTMMIEPTESEPKAELDRFIEAMISIREEIQCIIDGKYSKDDNPLKNAPHTAKHVCAEQWNHSYSRTVAAYPVTHLYKQKYWAPVARINNTYGDRNLVCTCPLVDSYNS